MRSAEPSYLELRGAVDLVLKAKYRLWASTGGHAVPTDEATDEAMQLFHRTYLDLLKDMHAAGGTHSAYLDFLEEE